MSCNASAFHLTDRAAVCNDAGVQYHCVVYGRKCYATGMLLLPPMLSRPSIASPPRATFGSPDNPGPVLGTCIPSAWQIGTSRTSPIPSPITPRRRSQARRSGASSGRGDDATLLRKGGHRCVPSGGFPPLTCTQHDSTAHSSESHRTTHTRSSNDDVTMLASGGML